jgi:prepilin peptidase CpaA
MYSMLTDEINVVQWGAVLGASLAAAILDMRKRRIPNTLTLPLVSVGIIVALGRDGLSGLGSSLGGCVLLALPYILLYALGGGGAGDAKMMGALGAWLGLRAGMIVLVAVALTGGVIGLVSMAASRERKTRLKEWLTSLYVVAVALASGRPGWILPAGDSTEPRQAGNRRTMIPYGPAIFIGVCIGAWVVHSWKI